MLVFTYQISRGKIMTQIIEFILLSCLFYVIVTIGIPATIAKATFDHQDLSARFELDSTFDSIVSLTNDLKSRSPNTSLTKKKQLRKILNESTDIYFNHKKTIAYRHQQLLAYKQTLLTLKNSSQ